MAYCCGQRAVRVVDICLVVIIIDRCRCDGDKTSRCYLIPGHVSFLWFERPLRLLRPRLNKTCHIGNCILSAVVTLKVTWLTAAFLFSACITIDDVWSTKYRSHPLYLTIVPSWSHVWLLKLFPILMFTRNF